MLCQCRLLYFYAFKHPASCGTNIWARACMLNGNIMGTSAYSARMHKEQIEHLECDHNRLINL
jgi:hypothetical protein